jgi:hypothetical protein
MKKFWTSSLILIMNLSFMYGQLKDSDSLIIIKCNAIRLTDSIHSSLPNSIRNIISDYLKKKGFEPDKYFTLGQNEIQIYGEDGIIELHRIISLRDILFQKESGNLKVGGSGGEGDDIMVICDKNFMKVKKIVNAE